MSRIAGVCYLKVDGAQYALRGGLTVSIDSVEREGVAGMDGVHGYIERPRVPFITADLTDTAGLSLDALQRITAATVTVELANGKVYLLREAWTAEAREINAVDGTVSVRFEGVKGEEVMA
ncbi:MAG TPA: phage tail tube protein [Kaistia sp.]|jgi:hypothetical protein|nr:phage tail tube protein [Kaistia sp.]